MGSLLLFPEMDTKLLLSHREIYCCISIFDFELVSNLGEQKKPK
jgi:hypothetical protein